MNSDSIVPDTRASLVSAFSALLNFAIGEAQAAATAEGLVFNADANPTIIAARHALADLGGGEMVA